MFAGQYIYCPIDTYATLLFMKSENNATNAILPAAYRRLRARLERVGWLALGSVLERKLPGGGGPRYQWSRRVQGKTVTVALSPEQFTWLKAAIANQREVESLLDQMHQLTLDYMWKHLPSTSRRKRLSNKTLGLN
jgi:hypothetical protein